MMTGPLAAEIDALAERESFSGVVLFDGPEERVAAAYGSADRRHGIPNTTSTRFSLASGTKGITALTLVSLIADGALDLATTARSVLGGDLPSIDDGVTIEHLLAHRSGIGDYLDEDAIGDITTYVPPVPVQALTSTQAYLAALEGYPTVFAPGTRFAYHNGGYVVLALIAERVSGVPFEELVRRRVCEPARMPDTAFLRSDELPGGVAVGYLANDGLRTNVFHLPLIGSGDGGIFSTLDDIRALWIALFEGRIVPERWVAEMVRPRSDWPDGSKRYGLGFHLHLTASAVWLEGADAGVSFASTHDPSTRTTATVISNTTEGAWPLALLLDERMGL